MPSTEQEPFDVQKAATWTVRAITYLVYVYFVLTEIILALGFVLRLFGANPSAGFVAWIYRSLDRVMEPFRGIFAPIELGTTANDVPAVIDTSILFAMIVYGILVLVLRSFIDWLSHKLAVMEANRKAERAAKEAADAAIAIAAATPPAVVVTNQYDPATTGYGVAVAAPPPPGSIPPPPPGVNRP